MRTVRSLLFLLAAAGAAGCAGEPARSDPEPGGDAGSPSSMADAGPGSDAGPTTTEPDAGPGDPGAGDSGAGDAGAGDAGAGDAGAGDSGAGDAGPADAGPSDAGGTDECGAVAPSAEGVLTNVPTVRFTRAGGSGTLRTFRIELIETPRFSSVRWFGEWENTGPATVCIPSVQLFMYGADRLTVVEGPPYAFSGTLSSVCVAPGQRAVLHGIENDVVPTFVSSLREVRYAITGLDGPRAVPHPGAPIVTDLELHASGDEHLYAGHAETSRAIRNVRLTIIGRDSCGLAIGRWEAFPSDAVVRAGSFDFETFPEDGMPVDELVYSSFSEGSRTFAPGLLVAPPYDAEERDELARRERELADALDR